MIRRIAVLILIGLALSACVQSRLFACKDAPNHPYCPK
jgi:hypothetical protein